MDSTDFFFSEGRSDPMDFEEASLGHTPDGHTPKRYIILSSRMNYSQSDKQLVLQLCLRECGPKSEVWNTIISLPIRKGTLTFYAVSQPGKRSTPAPPSNMADMVKHVDTVKAIVAKAGLFNPSAQYAGDCGWSDRNAAIALCHSSGQPVFGERAHTVHVEYDYSETIAKFSENSVPPGQSTARIVNRMRGQVANLQCPSALVGAPVLDAPSSAFNWRFINGSNNFQCPLTLLDLENYHLRRLPAINAPMIIQTDMGTLEHLSFDNVEHACVWLNEHMCFKNDPDVWLQEVNKELRVVTLDVGTSCLHSHAECLAAATGFIVPPPILKQKHEQGGGYAMDKAGAHVWEICSDPPCDVIAIIGPCDAYRETLMMEWKKSVNLLFDLQANGHKPLTMGVTKNIPNVPVILFDYAQMQELFLGDAWYWSTHNVPNPSLTHNILEEGKLVRLALEVAIDIKLDLQQVLTSSRLALAKSIVDNILSEAEMLPSHLALDFNYQCLANGRARVVDATASGKRTFDAALGQGYQSAAVLNSAENDDASIAMSLDPGTNEGGYRGGLVLPAKPGIYTDTTEFDFDSHYAAIMVEYSQFYTAANGDDNARLSARFKQQISSWITKKRHYKTQPDKADLSLSLKLKNNILYGCMGRQGNNVLGSTALASEITARGRALLQSAVKALPSTDSVLMGHTDALFVADLGNVLSDFFF